MLALMHNVLGGILTGIILAGFISSIAVDGVANLLETISNWEWETLAVGLIALSQYLLYKKTVMKEEANREKIAAAPYTPQLSIVCKYADECLKYAHKIHMALEERDRIEKRRNSRPPNRDHIGKYFTQIKKDATASDEGLRELLSQAVPELNNDVLKLITDAAIKYNSKKLRDLVLTFQVQNSRLHSLIERLKPDETDNTIHIVLPHDSLSAMKDASRLYVVASKLFKEFRGEWDFHKDNATEDEISTHITMVIGRDF